MSLPQCFQRVLNSERKRKATTGDPPDVRSGKVAAGVPPAPAHYLDLAQALTLEESLIKPEHSKPAFLLQHQPNDVADVAESTVRRPAKISHESSLSEQPMGPPDPTSAVGNPHSVLGGRGPGSSAPRLS